MQSFLSVGQWGNEFNRPVLHIIFLRGDKVMWFLVFQNKDPYKENIFPDRLPQNNIRSRRPKSAIHWVKNFTKLVKVRSVGLLSELSINLCSLLSPLHCSHSCPLPRPLEFILVLKFLWKCSYGPPPLLFSHVTSPLHTPHSLSRSSWVSLFTIITF